MCGSVWSDAHRGDQPVCLDQDSLQGGYQGGGRLQGRQGRGSLRGFYDQR